MKKLIAVIIIVLLIIVAFIVCKNFTSKQSETIEKENKNEEKISNEINDLKGETSKEPSNVINYKTSSFYVKNVNKFDGTDMVYYVDEDLYYTILLDVAGYKEWTEKFDIVTMKDIKDEDMKDKCIGLIFKKSKKRLNIGVGFNIDTNIAYVPVEETEEQYGEGVTGLLIIMDKGPYTAYEPYMK